MSTQVLQDFLVKIGVSVNRAQLSEANTGLRTASLSAATLDKEATAAAVSVDTKLIPSLKSMLLPLTAITAAIGFASRAMFKFVETSADGLERVSHLANRVNTTSEAVKKLGFVAQFSRSSVQAAESSLDGLNRAAGEAALGVGRGVKIFKEIGLSVQDSNGRLKDTSLLMTQLGDKIKDMGRGKQLAILEKLGIDKTMIEVLTTDVSGLGTEFDKIYKRAGINVNQASESAVKFKDALGKVGVMLSAIKDSVAISFFDEFKEGFDAFSKTLLNNMPKIIESLKPLISSFIKIGAVVIKVGSVFLFVASQMLTVISKVDGVTGGWTTKVLALTFAVKKLNFAFLRSPIGIFLELAAAFILLYDDYKTWEKGGNSFINWGNKSGEVIKNVVVVIAAMSTAFIAAKTALAGARVAMIAFTAVSDLNPILLAVTGIAAAVLLVTANLDKMQSAFKSAKEGISSVLDKSERFLHLKKDPRLALNGSSSSISDTFSKSLGIRASPLTSGNSLPFDSLNKKEGQSANGLIVNQETNIIVNGSGSPIETANEVKGHLRQVNGDMIRNTIGAVR